MESIVDETAAIPIQDLHLVRAALNSAYHQNTVLDLGDQYRKLHQRPQPSKLTQSLQHALTLIASYIEMANEPVQEEESGDE